MRVQPSGLGRTWALAPAEVELLIIFRFISSTAVYLLTLLVELIYYRGLQTMKRHLYLVVVPL
jgi:hypothetical protein